MTHNKTIVITGASDGIGAVAAQELAKRGHKVVVVGRNPQKTRNIAQLIGAKYFVCDFSNLSDVKELSENINKEYPKIDVLANNAGGIFDGPKLTGDGFEVTFQINHLAPFLLTQLLLPNLIENKSTVIQTSSLAARIYGKVNRQDPQHLNDFNANLAYGTAKLDNILFTKELHRRYSDQGIAAAAFHPGVVASGFGNNVKGSYMRYFGKSKLVRKFLITPEKGSRQLVWLAEGTPSEDWKAGEYYEKFKPARKFNSQQNDSDLAEWLWNYSADLLGISA